jgi:hypothetical protein
MLTGAPSAVTDAVPVPADWQILRVRAALAKRHHNRGRPRSTTRKNTPADACTYACECGQSFIAAASTHVACPACGHEQAW